MIFKIEKTEILEGIQEMMRARSLRGDPMSASEISNVASGNINAKADTIFNLSKNKGFDKISNFKGTESSIEKANRLNKFGEK